MRKLYNISFVMLMAVSVTFMFQFSSANATEKKMQEIKKPVISKAVKGAKVTMSNEKKVMVQKGHLKKLLDSGKIKVLPNGNVSYEVSSGYICETSNDTCLCAGDKNSEDCKAMFENICETDSEGSPIYTCLPGGCVCSPTSSSGVGSGGVSGGAAQTQTQE